MNSLLRAFAPALLGLTSLVAQNAEMAPLLSVAERSWPDKYRIGVVCDYRQGRTMVAELAQAARPGTVITVLNTYSANGVSSAQAMLRARNIDFLVLLPRDPVFFEGGPVTGQLITRLAHHGIPSVGTRPVGLKQGAVFCVGPETQGELLVTDKLVGTVSVILPNRIAQVLQPTHTFSVASLKPAGVTVSVLQGLE